MLLLAGRLMTEKLHAQSASESRCALRGRVYVALALHIRSTAGAARAASRTPHVVALEPCLSQVVTARPHTPIGRKTRCEDSRENGGSKRRTRRWRSLKVCRIPVQLMLQSRQPVPTRTRISRELERACKARASRPAKILTARRSRRRLACHESARGFSEFRRLL